MVCMEPLQTTRTDLTEDKLNSYAKAGMPIPPQFSPATVSTDPSVFRGDGYIKALNLTQFIGIVYGGGIDGKLLGTNQKALQAFEFQSHEFAEHKDTAAVPVMPKYNIVDLAAFDQWWAQYEANMGQDAPPLFFIKPAPALPAVQLVSADAPAPVPAATDGPIGAAVTNNPGVFNSSGSGDTYPDGYLYPGPTGIYQKHIYNSPFTAGSTRVIWIKLQ